MEALTKERDDAANEHAEQMHKLEQSRSLAEKQTQQALSFITTLKGAFGVMKEKELPGGSAEEKAALFGATIKHSLMTEAFESATRQHTELLAKLDRAWKGVLKKNEDVLATGMDKKNDAQFEEIFNALSEAERSAVQPVLRIVAHAT